MTDDPEESVTNGRATAILIECGSRFSDFFLFLELTSWSEHSQGKTVKQK